MASTKGLTAWRKALEEALYAAVRDIEYNRSRTV